MGSRTKKAMFVSTLPQHRKEEVRIVLKPSENFITLQKSSLKPLFIK